MAKGKIPAEVLFIGEGPGDSEDTLGVCFIGPAGKLLDQFIAIAESRCGFSPTKCFTNLVGCMPRDEVGGLKRVNGAPTKDEILACSPRLEEMLQLCKPKLIVAVGSLSEKRIKVLGWSKEYEIIDIPHPAFILRSTSPAQKEFSTKQSVVRLADAFERLSNV